MKAFLKLRTVLLTFLIIVANLQACSNQASDKSTKVSDMKEIVLPEPSKESSFSLEQALSMRRSVRSFTNQTITLTDISQLLWAAQGITEPGRGFRTSPSAGATFPIEIYVVVTNVSDVEQGLYHYNTSSHVMKQSKSGDLREYLLNSALMQQWLSQAAAIIVICADYSRTSDRYGDRGIRYVHMESGHVGQNLALQAVVLGLGTTMVGAFQDDQLSEVLDLPANLQPLYIIPVGHPR